MQLNDLPDDVLAMVLGAVRATSEDQRLDFRDALPLLSICQRWRQLALPMVYDSVYLQYGTETEGHSRTALSSIPAGAEPDSVEITTNLDLVVAAGCASLARKVAIHVHHMANPFPGFRLLIQRMCAVSSEWAAVRSLGLTMHSGRYPSNESSIDAAKVGCDVGKVRDALAAMFPGVRVLSFGDASSTHIAVELYGQLAGLYAKQLRVLHSWHPIAVPQDCLFMQLRDVTINGDYSHDYRLPRMCPETIERLRLVGMPADHSWSTFSAGSGHRAIAFPKLRYLSAMYHCDTERAEEPAAERHHGAWEPGAWQPCELQFPALKYLGVRCSGTTCPLLENAMLPPGMVSITLAAGTAVYQSIASKTLPAARSMSLYVTPQANNEPRALSSVCRMLERARGCTLKSLDIRDARLPLLPADIVGTSLTQLTVEAPTSADTMIGLIRKLSNLSSLTLAKLELGNTQTDLSIPESRTHKPVEQLNTRISNLSLRLSHQLYSPELAAAMIKYVLLGTPALTRLYVTRLPKRLIHGFVAAYCESYPHLARVSLQLNEC